MEGHSKLLVEDSCILGSVVLPIFKHILASVFAHSPHLTYHTY